MFPPSKTADSPVCPTLRDRREATVNRTADPMANLFARAASSLLGEDVGKNRGAPMSGCCWRRSVMPPQPNCRRMAANTRPRRITALACSKRRHGLRVFSNSAAPDAPGLVCFGAEFDPALADPMHAGSPMVGVSGVGLSPREAFQGCIGEGIEYLSQLQTGNDVLERASPGDPAAQLGPQGREFLAAFSAHRLQSRRRTFVAPRDAADRRPRGLVAGGSVPAPAAGPAGDQAAVSAEHRIGRRHVLGGRGLARHARTDRAGRRQPVVAGRPTRRIDPAAARGPCRCQANCCHGCAKALSPRRSWLLDITTDIGVPCVAAALLHGGWLRSWPLDWRRGRRSQPRPAPPSWKCVRSNLPMQWSRPNAASAGRPRSMRGIACIGDAPP